MSDWREELLYTMDDTYGCYFKRIVFRSIAQNDHEHCSICMSKISDSGERIDKEGYYCAKTGDWLCSTCMNDFKNRYDWKIEV